MALTVIRYFLGFQVMASVAVEGLNQDDLRLGMRVDEHSQLNVKMAALSLMKCLRLSKKR